MVMLLGSLMTLREDFSLEKSEPAGGFKYIKYPDSFRVASLDLSNELTNALTASDKSMHNIYVNMHNLPKTVRRAMKYLSPESPKSNLQYVELQLSKMLKHNHRSTKSMKQTIEAFEKVKNILNEFSTTTAARQALQDKDFEALNKTLTINAYQTKIMKEKLDKVLANEQKQLQVVSKYRKEYNKARVSVPKKIFGWLFNIFTSTTRFVTGAAMTIFGIKNDKLSYTLEASTPYAIDCMWTSHTSFEKMMDAIEQVIKNGGTGGTIASAICNVASIDFRHSLEVLSDGENQYNAMVAEIANKGLKHCKKVKSTFDELDPKNETLKSLLASTNDLVEKSHQAWNKMNAMFLKEEPKKIEEKQSGLLYQSEEFVFNCFFLTFGLHLKHLQDNCV